MIMIAWRRVQGIDLREGDAYDEGHENLGQT
jgi:hypothetical protein